MKLRALQIFIGTLLLTVASLVLLIQSEEFSLALKKAIQEYTPANMGVQGDFKDLRVLFFPPGIVINKPKVILQPDNILNLPPQTNLEFERLEVTFQFFQLMTGSVTVNALNVYGAKLQLDLDREFFRRQQRVLQKQKRSRTGTSWWHHLVSVNFRSIGIIDSDVDVTVSPISANSAFSVKGFARELTLSRGVRGNEPVYEMAADLSDCSFKSSVVSHTIAAIKASFELSLDQISVRSLSFQEGETTFHSNGVVQGNIAEPKNLNADINYIFKTSLSDLFRAEGLGHFVKIPKRETLSGKVTLEGRFAGDFLNLKPTLALKTSFQAEEFTYETWRVKSANGKGEFKDGKVTVNEAGLNFNPGAVKLSDFLIDPAAEQPVKAGRVALDNADFRALMGPHIVKAFPIHMFLTGTADFRALESGPHFLEIQPRIKVTKFALDNQSIKEQRPRNILIAVNELDIAGPVLVGKQDVAFRGIDAQAPHTRLGLNGRIDFKTGLDLDIKGKLDLQDLGKLADFDIRGKGDLHWTVKGQPEAVLFTFDADLQDAQYLDLNLGATKGRVLWDDGKNVLQLANLAANPAGQMRLLANGAVDFKDSKDLINVQIDVSKGNIRDFTVLMDKYIKRSIPWYPYELSGDLSGTVFATGKVDPSQLSIEGDILLQNVDYLGEVFRFGTFHGGFRRNGFVAERIQIRKKAGWIRGDMSFSPESVLSYNFNSEGLSTQDVDHISGFNIPYVAPMNLVAKGSGKIDALDGRIALNVGTGSVKAMFVPASEFVAQFNKGRLVATASALGGQATARYETFEPYFSDGGSNVSLDLEAKDLNFEPLLVALNPQLADDPTLEGRLAGNAQLKFHSRNISRLTGSVALQSYHQQKRGFFFRLVSPVSFKIDRGNYSFSNVKFSGLNADITASGRVTDGQINYDIKGDFPLSLFEFVTPELPVLKGSLGFNARLTGRADSPDFFLTGKVENADLRVARIEQSFESLMANVNWKDNHVNITNISAKFGGGTVRGAGNVVLHLTRAPELDAKFDLDNPKFKIYPFSYLRTTGKLTVRGQTLPYLLEGDVQIADALIQENFSNGDNRALRSSQFLPRQGNSGTGEYQLFELGISADADRNIFVKNDLFDTELRGKLKVLGPITTPRLLGQLEVLHGKIIFKDSTFMFQNAVIKFLNPAVLDPEFQLTANTDHKGYKITLYANGKVSDPKINFRSQPPLPQEDIVTLLTLGVTSSGYRTLRSQDRDAYSRDEVYSLLFSQSGINKGLNQKFGVQVGVDQAVNNLNQDSAFRRNNDPTLNVAPKVTLQKEIVRNLNAKVGSTVGVGDSRQQDVNLEYQMGKNASVLGVYEDQRGATPKNSRTSMGVDLKFRWNFK